MVLSGETARKVLSAMRPFVSAEAVFELFEAWSEGTDETALTRAIRTCQEAIDVMRISEQSDLELGGELSRSLSRLGFLQSFDDELVSEARSSLEEAQRIGEADGWVTDWNIANLCAREGDMETALRRLDGIDGDDVEMGGSASLLFYFPDRPASDSLVAVKRSGFKPILALQRAVVGGDDGARAEAVATAKESGDEGAVLAAEWVEQGAPQPA